MALTLALLATVTALPAEYATVFPRLDVTRPGLENVRAAVDAGKPAAAAVALRDYYRQRTKPVFIADRTRPAPDPQFDPRRADAVLRREFTFVGKTSTLTHDIDWNADPLHDIEWPIELNRHGIWVTLADAWWRTGEVKYLDDLVYQVSDWLADNPRPGGPRDGKWTWRTLECGIRLDSSWPWVFDRVVHADGFPPELLCAMLESVWEQTDYLRQFHGGGNWLVCERAGMLTTGIVWPEFNDAPAWCSTAWETLTHELETQVYPDGAQFELTPHYHGATLSSFQAACNVAELNDVPLPPAYQSGLQRMYEYLLWVVKPDGCIPMFNDSDHDNDRSWLARGAQRFGREDMRYVATGGKEGTPPADTSHAFRWAGQYVMRSGWSGNDVFLAMDAGPYGFGHQHEDKLGIDVWGYGQELILDPGRFTYAGGKWRSYFVSTASHSTVLVDGKGQRRSTTPRDTWVTREPLANRWVHIDALDLAVGSYADGYGGADDPIHVRKVLFLRPDVFVVSDLLLPRDGRAAGREATVQYQLARPAAGHDDATGACWSTGPGANVLLAPVSDPAPEVELHEGEEDPPCGWIAWSLHRAEKTAATMVKYRVPAQPPFAFETVILPYPGEQPPKLTARRLPVMLAGKPVPPHEATALEILRDGRRDVCYLSHAAERRTVTVDGRETAAEAALWRFGADGKLLSSSAVAPPTPVGTPVAETLDRLPIEVSAAEPARFRLRYGYASGGGYLFETEPTEPADSAALRVRDLQRDLPYVFEVLSEAGGQTRVVRRGVLRVPSPKAFDFEDDTLQGWTGNNATVAAPGNAGSRGCLRVQGEATRDVQYVGAEVPVRVAAGPTLRVRFAARAPLPVGGKWFYAKLWLEDDAGDIWASYFANAPWQEWRAVALGPGDFRGDTYNKPEQQGKPLPAGARIVKLGFTLRKDATEAAVGGVLELDDVSAG
ncbi:MAG: alginate lyase family protein [Armatimonadetes bacterium]|nr:alginate lyase family protein [Armatimonadota bacterium]